MSPRRTSDHAGPGTLYVVATPLGNLEDLSPRGRAVLGDVACIACEDTRRTARLLERFGITTPTISCHRFNEAARLAPVLERLRAGEDVALVSDGGTPGIADPGARLVAAALDAGLVVSPVPGPSACIAILSASGLPGDRFLFDGFLPHRGAERRTRLRELAREPRTVVVQETPHRILDALSEIDAIFGDRAVVLGRELTKVHETLYRGTAAEIRTRLSGGEVRGEIVLAIAGANPDGPSGPTRDDRDTEALRAAWTAATSEHPDDRRAALRTAARTLGVKRAELYRRLVEAGLVAD